MEITAAVARAVNAPFAIESISIEEPRDNEVLVRLVATGICHTDISMRDHKIYPVPHPVVLGHEGAGIIERVGRGVTKVAKGDHVILVSASCGHCPSCDAGLPVYCYHFNEHNFFGTRGDGTTPLSQAGKTIGYFQAQSSFATYSICTERNVVKVSKDAPLEMLGPFGCGVMTGAGAIINSMPVDVGDSVAVFGTGAVGLSAIMAAKLVGAATIVAVDLLDARLELARELGATDVINPGREDTAAALKRITGGNGLNFALDTTANMRVLRQAIDALAPRGTCGFVGGAPPGMELVVDVEHVMVGGRTIRGIIQGDSNADVFLPKLVDLFVKGRFPIDKLVTFYPFADINRAVEDALSGKTVKPILRF